MKKQSRDERELELYKFSAGSQQSIAHQYRRAKGHIAPVGTPLSRLNAAILDVEFLPAN